MPEGVAVRAFVRTPEALVVQDANGALWSVPLEDGTDGEPQVLMQGHSGAITGLDTSPVDHFAFTCGADATVRCWDYVDQKQIAMTSFNASATSLVWANTQVDPNGRTVAVGFANGVVRVLMRGSEDIPLLHVFKPHTGKVLCVSYSGDGSYLATGGEDGLLFLLRIADSEESPDGKEYTPVGFVDLAAPVTSIDWNSRNDAVLVSLGANGGAAEVRMPDGTPNTATSYELRLDTRKFTFQPPTPKPTAEELAAKAAAEEEARRRAEEGEDPERPSTADLVNPFEQAKIDPGASLAAVYSPIADTPNASFLVRGCVAAWLRGCVAVWLRGCGRGDSSALTLLVFWRAACAAVCGGHRVQRPSRVHVGPPQGATVFPVVRWPPHVRYSALPQRQVPVDGQPGRQCVAAAQHAAAQLHSCRRARRRQRSGARCGHVVRSELHCLAPRRVVLWCRV